MFVRPGRASSKSLGLLSRGFGSRPLFLQRHGSRPAVRYSLDFSSVEPVSLAGRSMASPTLSILQRCFRSTAGAAILCPSPQPDAGGPSSISPGPSCLSVYLTDPPLTRTPRSRGSGGSPLVCLHRNPHREHQGFSYGVDSFICNDRFISPPLTRSSDNPSFPSRYIRRHLFCLLSAGVAHLPCRSEVVAVPPTYNLHIGLTSSPMLPVRGFITRGPYLACVVT